MVIVGGDSHTSTHGAFGNLSFGIGALGSAAHDRDPDAVAAPAQTMRIRIDGPLGFGIAAKDVILAIIGRIGIGGAAEHVIEYAGSTIADVDGAAHDGLQHVDRAGARAGMVAPDATTYAYMEGGRSSPKATTGRPPWRSGSAALRSEATFDRSIDLDARDIAPMVTWGTNPEHALADHRGVPDLTNADADKRAEIESALAYMGVAPGTRLTTSRSTVCSSAMHQCADRGPARRRRSSPARARRGAGVVVRARRR